MFTKLYYTAMAVLLTVSCAQASDMNSDSANPRAVCHNFTEPDFYEFSDMYFQMMERYNEMGAQVTDVQQELDFYDNDLTKLVQSLTIELSMEEIRDTYKKFGVLQLRPLKGNRKVLLGCGNCPMVFYQPSQNDRYELSYSHEIHRHEDYITINPELSMNPTIVAAFGFDDLQGLLPTDFTKVVFEGFTPPSSEEFKKHFKTHFGGAKIRDVRYNAEMPVNKLETMYWLN